MLDPRVPLVAGMVVTAVLATALASRIGEQFGIGRDRAFRLLVAAGAVSLGLSALAGIVVGNILGAWEIGQAVGTYAGIAAEGWLALMMRGGARQRPSVD